MIAILERIGYHSRNVSEAMIDIDELSSEEETEHTVGWTY